MSVNHGGAVDAAVSAKTHEARCRCRLRPATTVQKPGSVPACKESTASEIILKKWPILKSPSARFQAEAGGRGWLLLPWCRPHMAKSQSVLLLGPVVRVLGDGLNDRSMCPPACHRGEFRIAQIRHADGVRLARTEIVPEDVAAEGKRRARGRRRRPPPGNLHSDSPRRAVRDQAITARLCFHRNKPLSGSHRSPAQISSASDAQIPSQRTKSGSLDIGSSSAGIA